jgi:hypothetical protein
MQKNQAHSGIVDNAEMLYNVYIVDSTSPTKHLGGSGPEQERTKHQLLKPTSSLARIADAFRRRLRNFGYLTEGGAQEVYRRIRTPKSNTKTSKLIVKIDKQGTVLPRERTEQTVQEERKRQALLGEYFPHKNIAHVHHFSVKADPRNSFPMATQLAVPQILAHKNSTYCFSTQYCEIECEDSSQEFLNAYTQMSDSLLTDTTIPCEMDTFFTEQISDDVRNLLDESQKNPQCKEMLKDFVQRCIRMFRETGEIVDTIGNNNIIFFRENGEWKYKLVDPLLPLETAKAMKNAQTIVQSYIDYGLTGETCCLLLNLFNFARSINGMAVLLGIEERVHVLPKDFERGKITFPWEKFYNETHRLLHPSQKTPTPEFADHEQKNTDDLVTILTNKQKR